MGRLRFASVELKSLDLGEGDSLEVISDLSKRDFNSLLREAPQTFGMTETLRPVDADDFTTALFVSLVRGWSLELPCTKENYLNLDRPSADIIDSALVTYFNELSPSVQEQTKSKRVRG